MEWLKNLSSYTDSYGFFFHYDDEGRPEFGDGINRFGLYWIVEFFKNTFLSHPFLTGFDAAFFGFLEPVRYPYDHSKWYGQQGFMSRDNLIPCFCCLVMIGDFKRASRLFRMIIRRGGFLWNTKHIGQQEDRWKVPDWCGFVVIALSVRAWINSLSNHSRLFAQVLSLPFLHVLDLSLLLSSVMRIIQLTLNADNCGDCLNLICVLSTIKESNTETLLSFSSRMIYSGLHPGAGPSNRERIRGYGPLTSFQHYFAGDRNPPFDEHWKPYLIERF